MAPRSTPTILVTGANGQVGRALLKTLTRLGRVVAADLAQTEASLPVETVDFTSADSVLALVHKTRPDAIVNPAAYTAVDKAESEGETASRINALAPGLLAGEARRLGIPLIHYSTDYVFDGSGSQARREDAPTGPLSVYGRTKLEGEQAVLAAGADALIFRTSWVFSDHGHNFVKTMLRLGQEREELRVVADQVGAPTSAHFLAVMTALALERGMSRGFAGLKGVYHLCNAGETSWHGFAEEIFRQARAKGRTLKVKSVLPIRTEDYPTPAQRPRNSRLDCGRFQEAFGLGQLQTWQAALGEVMEALS